MITAPQEENNTGSVRPQQRKPQALVRRSSFDEKKGMHYINFVHLGKRYYYNLMLWANTPISQQKWLETIYKQQQVVRERSMIFETVTLSEGFFSGPNKVNCAAPYSQSWFLFLACWCCLLALTGGGRRVVYGTDDGVYLSDLREKNQEPVKVLALLDVIQVDVLEDFQLLIVLSGVLCSLFLRNMNTNADSLCRTTGGNLSS